MNDKPSKLYRRQSDVKWVNPRIYPEKLSILMSKTDLVMPLDEICEKFDYDGLSVLIFARLAIDLEFYAIFPKNMYIYKNDSPEYDFDDRYDPQTYQ